MNFLHTEIGSAKDNFKSPIHNWYKFTAGFSHRFVDEIIEMENLSRKKNSQIFDPFAGCGTTLVSCQKAGISAVGNEAQKFMYDVIRAKLNWKLEKAEYEFYLKSIKADVLSGFSSFDIETHPLLKSLYTADTLKQLYLLKESILSIPSTKYKLFFKLALSQTLHKVCIHPIAVPYISRNKILQNTDKPVDFFESITDKMFTDAISHSTKKKTSRIHLQDSRQENPNIGDDDCNLCITSPPYLNNLDYGEVSKVHTHFFDITNDWNDITKNVRQKLVTGSTTHYAESTFNLADFKKTEFSTENVDVANTLIKLSQEIKEVSKLRKGKKSFDILTLLYFQDMYEVLKEIRRVVRKGNNAYLILGDSAPYGIYIPTTELLGAVSKSAGFSKYSIHKIRSRGGKWKSLKYRHNVELTENVLVLR